MKLFLWAYIIIIIIYLLKISWNKRLYIFSPFCIIYLNFTINDVIPLLMHDSSNTISGNIMMVTCLSAVINLSFLFIKWDEMCKGIVLTVPPEVKPYNKKRLVLIILLMLILFSVSLYTGVITTLLSGGNVENLRRTSEVGLGFLTKIPNFCIIPLLFSMFLCYDKINYKTVAIVCLLTGLFLFCLDAGRAHVLISLTLFLSYINIKNRSLKWFEYIGLFVLLSPIASKLLFFIRNGQMEWDFENLLFSQQRTVFEANTTKMVEYFEHNRWLMGLSYILPLTMIIPRFIWADKPMAIDYYYKDAVNYEFDGGGIYTTVSMDFYINFGFYFVIPYILWIMLIHFFYKKVLNDKTNYNTKIFLLCFITFFSAPGKLIENCWLYILSALLLYLYFGKKKII